MLRVHEIFNSIQGEGSKQGQQMTFVRLYGCNRTCSFCDQPQGDYIELAEEQIVEKCTLEKVCITGGEPLLQDIYLLCELLDQEGKFISLETNGDFNTLAKWGYDNKGMRHFRRVQTSHVACSPKVKKLSELKLDPDYIDDLKILVTTQTTPNDLMPWEEFAHTYNLTLWLQPENFWTEINWDNLKHATKLCLDLPMWNLSPQLHKLLGVR